MDTDKEFDSDEERSDLDSPSRACVKAKSRRSGSGALREGKEWVRNVFDKQKDLLRQSADNLKTKKKNFEERLQQRRNEINQRINEPVFLLFREKVAFFAGVVNLLMTELLLLKCPHAMWLWYTVWIIPLLGIRYYLYHQSKWHYFMLDFCYFSQCLLLFYIYVYPSSDFLFHVMFSISNGSLMWAVIAWRNSLVFHDLDKMTSSFIHLFPALVTYCIRWFPHPGRWALNLCHHQDKDTAVALGCSGEITFAQYFIVPMILYLIWQICYVMKTEYVDKKKFEKDTNIQTSFRWLSKSQGHIIYRICSKYPPKWRLLVFCAIQTLFTMLTSLPTKWFYESFYLHTGFFVFIVLTAIWNGGGYYIVFLNKKMKMAQENASETTSSSTSSYTGGDSASSGKTKTE